MQNKIKKQKESLLKKFEGCNTKKLEQLDNLIEQAAYESVQLETLNKLALDVGYLEINPENAKQQRTLPVSGEIAKHSAALTNIMDKLMKHLAIDNTDEGADLGMYE